MPPRDDQVILWGSLSAGSTKSAAQNNTPHYSSVDQKALCWFTLRSFNANNAAAHIDHLDAFATLKNRVEILLQTLNNNDLFAKGFESYDSKLFKDLFAIRNKKYHARQLLMMFLYRNSKNVHMLQAAVNIHKSDSDFVQWLKNFYPKLHQIFSLYLNTYNLQIFQGMLGPFVSRSQQTNMKTMKLDGGKGHEELHLHCGENYNASVLRSFYDSLQEAIPSVAECIMSIESNTSEKAHKIFFDKLEKTDLHNDQDIKDLNRTAEDVDSLYQKLSDAIYAKVEEKVNASRGYASPTESEKGFAWGLAATSLETSLEIYLNMRVFTDFVSLLEERGGGELKAKFMKYFSALFKHLALNNDTPFITDLFEQCTTYIITRTFDQKTKSKEIFSYIEKMAFDLQGKYLQERAEEAKEELARKRQECCSGSSASSEEEEEEEEFAPEELEDTDWDITPVEENVDEEKPDDVAWSVPNLTHNSQSQNSSQQPFDNNGVQPQILFVYEQHTAPVAAQEEHTVSVAKRTSGLAL